MTAEVPTPSQGSGETKPTLSYRDKLMGRTEADLAERAQRIIDGDTADPGADTTDTTGSDELSFRERFALSPSPQEVPSSTQIVDKRHPAIQEAVEEIPFEQRVGVGQKQSTAGLSGKDPLSNSERDRANRRQAHDIAWNDDDIFAD